MTILPKHPSGRRSTPISKEHRDAVVAPTSGPFDRASAALTFRDLKARQELGQGKGCAFICRARIDRLIQDAQMGQNIDHLVANALGPTRAAIAKHKARQA